jgi:hypothetical protein
LRRIDEGSSNRLATLPTRPAVHSIPPSDWPAGPRKQVTGLAATLARLPLRVPFVSFSLWILWATACASSSGPRPAVAAGAAVGQVATPSSGPAPTAVAAAPPPKDDGNSAAGGKAGLEHAAALEELKVARLAWGADHQGSLRVLLPDAGHWLRVKFWGMKSLVGFRYGKDHHAVVGAVVLPVSTDPAGKGGADETAPGACGKAFEAWAQPYVDAFEVAIEYEPPRAAPWSGKIAEIDSLIAKTATLGVHDEYVVAYGAYPAWPGQCLVLGVAVPARDEIERARAVRDRFVAEILPKVLVTSKTAPKETY